MILKERDNFSTLFIKGVEWPHNFVLEVSAGTPYEGRYGKKSGQNSISGSEKKPSTQIVVLGILDHWRFYCTGPVPLV